MEALTPLFVHVPRTGGQSVSLCFFGKVIGHFRASEFDTHPASAWRFGFVRNPYDRLRSAFNWWKYEASPDDPWANEHVRPWALSGWVMNRLDCLLPHFPPQSFWIDRPMHFIGRYERLQEGVDYIRSSLGLSSARLGIVNTSGQHGEDYTPEARSRVRDIYADDFTQFRYE